MYCRNCGRLNDDNNFKCLGCGKELRTAVPAAENQASACPPQAYVPGYSGFAWTVMILPFFCCCMPGFLSAPFCIVSLVFSADVKKKLARGDVEGARKSSKRALMWSWIGVAAAVISFVLFFGLMSKFGYNMKDPSKWY